MGDQRLPYALSGAAVGGALVLASAWLWVAQRADVPPPTAPLVVDDVPRTGTTAPTTQTTVDLSPVLLRLDDLAARLERLEGRITNLADASARTPAATPFPPATLDADTVLAAMEAAERKKVDALSDKELLHEALRLQKVGDAAAAQQRLQALLQRPLTPEQRGRAQTELATLLRNRGDADSVAAAVAMFQSVVDTHGLASEIGSQAGLQLVWTDVKGNGAARGLAQAQLLVETPGVPAEIVRNARWATGIMAQNLGDTVRARAEFASLLRDLDGMAGQEKLIEDIRRRLAGQ